MNEPENSMPTIEFEPFDPICTEAEGREFALRPGPDSPLVLQRNSSELIKEQFRDLETRLNELRSAQPVKNLLITSAVPKEGKTFVAANLALGLVREAQKRVLLIDADIRRPSVHSFFGIANECGFKDLLLGGRNIWRAVTKMTQSELYVMPSGKAPCESLSLLTVERISALLKHLRAVFDLIMLDSSPLLVASDTRLVSSVVDATLLVVKCGSTPREMVRKGQEVLNGKPILGTVLNRVDANHSTYSSYYSYVNNTHKEQTRK